MEVLPLRVDGLTVTGRRDGVGGQVGAITDPDDSPACSGASDRGGFKNGTVWFGRLLWGVMEGEDLPVLGCPGGRGWSGEQSLALGQEELALLLEPGQGHGASVILECQAEEGSYSLPP